MAVSDSHFLYLVILLFLSPTALLAQTMQVTKAGTAPFTADNLISNVFLGNGVDVISITYSGQDRSVGYFTNGTQAVGLERGIVLSTGLSESGNPGLGEFGSHEVGNVFANNVIGGFVPGSDSDLGPLVGGGLYDITRYTITFVPTADTLRFRYCFASEEYPEFACSQYNDIFGFFIQGPNYPTPTNIALIPGSNLPVSINNIHPDNSQSGQSCPPKNLQYYIGNTGSNKQPTYDGLTTVFTAEAIVVPCETYTIKLVIADVGDPNYDSGVFLEAKSFGTGALRAQLSTPSLDGTITEGCAAGSLRFYLPAPTPSDFMIDYTILGNAANGIDYQLIPSNLFIPAGEQEITIPIIALEDGIAENSEYLAIDVRRDPCTRDTIRIVLRDNSMVPPDQLLDTSLCLGAAPVLLNGALPIALPAPPSFTNDQDFSIHPVNSTIFSSVNVFGVLPPVLQPGMIRSVCLNATHNWVDDLDVYLVSPGGQFLELMTDCGADGKNFTNTCFTPAATRNISQAVKADAPFTGDWLPEGPWSDLWGGGAYPANGTWTLQVRDDKNGFIGTLHDWTITFEPLYGIDYQWTPVAGLSCADCPKPEASPTTTTTYQLLATDSYGCTLQDSVKVSVFQALPAPVVYCNGYTNNSITFSWAAVPGAASYQVNVNSTGWVAASGTTNHIVNNLGPNAVVTIEVQGIDNATTPCPALIGVATCSNCNQPAVAVAPTAESCAGANDGNVVLTPDGLNPPYTFAFASQSNTTGVFPNLAAGTYTATVTDNSGCQSLVPVTISAPLPIQLTINPTHVICFNGDDGAAQAMVSGGNGGFTYQWNDPANQKLSNAVNLRSGTYTVTVTDNKGCSATASTTLSQPPDLLVFVTPDQAKCFGEASGQASVSAGGGISPYQFNWNTGQSGPIATGLSAGTYTITVTDAAGCAKTSFALIGQPSPITAIISSQPVLCADDENGNAAILAQGGTGILNYQWNDPAGQTTAQALNLAAGTYTVTITDQNGCTLTLDTVIATPPPIVLDLNSTPASCYGTADGTASVQASGGAGNLFFQWSDPAGQTGPTANNLPAGTYSVTVTDGNGCQVVDSLEISQPAQLQANIDVQDVRCFNGTDGAASATIQGGTGPYSFAWSSGETTAGISNKTAGVYTITITDAPGCTSTASVTIDEPPALTVSVFSKNITCFGGADGTAQLTINGGAGKYTVSWSGPNGYSATGPSISNISSGNYTAVITDSVGCTLNQAVSIDQPATALSVQLPITGDTICFGAMNGTATASASGGTTPYAYLWNINNQTGPAITGLASGWYSVLVTDANSCTGTASVFIPQQEQLHLTAEGGSVDCFGANDGTASVTQIFYGNTPANPDLFSYSWNTNPPQNSRLATGLQAGKTYTVTITDDLGCTATQTASIADVPPIGAAILFVMNPSCSDSADGRIIAGGQGGTAPYTYTWPPSAATAMDSLATNLPAGSYRVTVSDAKGCTGSVTATLIAPTALKIDFRPTPALCFGDSTGRVQAIPGGGTPEYTFAWSTGSKLSEIQQIPAGNYQLTLTDRNGCTISDSIDIGQPATPLDGMATKMDAGCSGDFSGTIQIQPSGGTPPYRYTLDDKPWNGSSKQIGLGTGTYLPRIQDKNGCLAELDPVKIDERVPVQVDLGPSITINYGESAQLTASVSNALQPVMYSWNPADSSWLSCLNCPDPEVQNLEYDHWFILEVKDSSGCSAESRVLVSVLKQRKVFVPTAFSPNGDGTNDRLLAHGQHDTQVIVFQVYDRWGELVYEGGGFRLNDEDNGWDGTFRGQLMNPGVYVWVLEVEYADGVRDTYRGSTNLIR